MTDQRPILDAGPSLNFLSIKKERLLIGVLGKLSAPETVRTEVLRKALPDRASMRDVYDRLRALDDGLPPIEKTDLLSPIAWPS